MNFNLSKRIDLGYIVIVAISLVSLGYSILAIQHNRELDMKIQTSYLPLYFYLNELKTANEKIQKIATQCIYLPNRDGHEKILKFIYEQYPKLKESTKKNITWPAHINHSILEVFVKFDQVILYDIELVAILDNNAYSREERQQKVKNILITKIDPLADNINKSLLKILEYYRIKFNRAQEEKENSDTMLSLVLSVLFICIIIIGLLGHRYVQKTIVKPIIEIKDLIVTLGIGKAIPIKENNRKDEIGEILCAINCLAQNLTRKVEFAHEIGKGNYEVKFKLLSEVDVMGIALLSMRNSLKYRTEIEKIRTLENKRLAMVANRTTNLVILTKENGEIEWVNPAFSSITGYTQEGAIGRNLEILVPGSLKMFQKTHGFNNIELISQAIDGRTFYLSLEIQPVVDDLGNLIQYIVMGTDITERKAVQKALEDQNEELKKVNSELDRFVYSASHDLRAPIASLLGLIEVARMENSLTVMEDLLNKQKRTLLRLDKFIKDIVNYSYNSRLEVEIVKIDFNKIIQEILDQLQYMESFEKINKIITINDDGKFYSSEIRINMAINNLIVNSIKYANLNSTNPFLNIFIQSDSLGATIKISDNGEGIPDHSQGKIFDMFYRASARSSGSGLGLYITKEAVQKMNGAISVVSRLGYGTEFTINIPGNYVN